MKVMIDVPDWWDDRSKYDDCLKICKQLDLIEIVWHGEHDYGRITDKGCEVLMALLTMLGARADPKNKLEIS